MHPAVTVASPGGSDLAPPSAPPVVRRTSTWLRLAAAAAAGLLLYLAFPPVGWWPTAFVGVALLTLTCRGVSARRGALLGLVTGLAFFLPLLEWSGTIAGAGAWLALSALQAAFFAPLGAALAMVTRLAGWPLWTALLWVAEEALRARLPFGGFPWGRLAFSQADAVLVRLAALGGAPLVSAAVALLGAGLAAVLLRQWRWAAVALVVPAPLLVPMPVDGPPTTIAIVQGNVPRLGLGVAEQQEAVLENHVTGTRRLAEAVRAGRSPRPDLVVWPENASDRDPYTDPAARALIDAAVRDVGVPVLVGALVDGPGEKVSNVGIVWDPVTGPGATYVKRHPVPFGEYIPYRDQVRRLTKRVDLVPRDFASGDRTGVLQVGPALVGDVICFEVAYDGLVRDAVAGGGRLLVVQTNNASFGRSGETSQQLAMGRLRAVEHGRAVLVAATSGISAVIAPTGQVRQRTGIFTADVLVARVPLRDGSTPATRVGGWPELALALAGAAALIVARVRT